MAEMQNLFYDEAPYHILYYEDTLVAYRTDKFGGWQNQPANGVPLFGYGPLDYTLLTPAVAATPSRSAARRPPRGRPARHRRRRLRPGPTPPRAAPPSPSSSPLVVVAGLAVGALVLGRRRRAATDANDDED